jgi:hypothetical protein
VVAKVEWNQGELYPRVGFIVTNLSQPNRRVVKFYNGRGTAEQHIKESKNAIRWTRLSCHERCSPTFCAGSTTCGQGRRRYRHEDRERSSTTTSTGEVRP